MKFYKNNVLFHTYDSFPLSSPPPMAICPGGIDRSYDAPTPSPINYGDVYKVELYIAIP